MDTTVADLAEQLRITPAWVTRICAKHSLGRMANPRMRLLSADDVQRFRQIFAEIPEGRNPSIRRKTRKNKRKTA